MRKIKHTHSVVMSTRTYTHTHELGSLAHKYSLHNIRTRVRIYELICCCGVYGVCLSRTRWGNDTVTTTKQYTNTNTTATMRHYLVKRRACVTITQESAFRASQGTHTNTPPQHTRHSHFVCDRSACAICSLHFVCAKHIELKQKVQHYAFGSEYTAELPNKAVQNAYNMTFDSRSARTFATHL